jgi:hypothetical protein
MIVQYGRVVSNTNLNNYNNYNLNNYNYSSSHRHNKGGTINVTKAVAMKSTLMQITRVKVANGFH